MEIKKTLKLIVRNNNDLFWKDMKTQEIVGAGYKTDSGRLALVRCPMCMKENYAMNVPSGICTWCGFDANYEEKND